jgi:ribose 1,5-bisphosphate isomerase
MREVDRVVKNIKTLKIQGAECIARESIKVLQKISKKSSEKEILRAAEKLKKSRPTEPCLRNAIDFVLKTGEYQTALNHFEIVEKKIAEYGSRKIENDMIIFTHCHSSTVTGILKEAKRQKKKFEVFVTETRPFFQGRITATELSKARIPVTLFVDSTVKLALKEADIMLLGADAITSEGKVINKIGSELFAEVANRFDIPVYICTDSWKFDPKSIFGFEEVIEKRHQKEVWKNPPRGVKINNYVFEEIDPDLIEGIISELGVYRFSSFLNELKKKYTWMFS